MRSLTDYYVPVAAWVQEQLGGTLPPAPQLKTEILSRIEQSRRAAIEEGIEEKVFEAGLFPVVAWIDESLMCASWAGATEWRTILLQKARYKIANGGVEFFRRLSALGPDPVDREILAVYYMVLHLGFQGQYGMKGGESSSLQVRHRLQALLEPVRSSEGAALCPGLLSPMNALPGAVSKNTAKNRRLKTLLLWGIPPGLLLILFAVFDRIVHEDVQNILAHIHLGH